MFLLSRLSPLSQRRHALPGRLYKPFWLLWFLSAIAAPTFAGHGFVTAFGNIEWLPEPGRSPDSVWYTLDAVREEGQLLLARTPDARVALCLSFAREKLAELEAMVKAENSRAAQVAADWYQTYLNRAKAVVEGQTEQTKKEALAESTANALLEHQYIIATIYPDLPLSSRQILLQTAAAAGEQYQLVAKLLPAKKKGALFFKEEEARWSLQMAGRADEENSSQSSAFSNQ
jgi:hypothetical protein